MSRLIDADAFDERVRVAGGMSEDELTDDFKDGVQAVLYMLSNQPTITPEPHWILVTERLPEKSGVYTVTDHKGDVVRFVFITGSDSSRRYWYRCAKAWIPLPEPYKGVTS